MFNQAKHDSLTLTSRRDYYEPFKYPKLFELAEVHRKMDWSIEQVKKISQDIKDWKTLPKQEKEIYETLLLYFTQADVDVAGSYFENLSKWYTQPEQRYWLARIINREATHVQCYAMLPEQFGIDKNKYSELIAIDAIYDQRQFMLAQAESDSFTDRIYTLVKHICGEGIGIYGIFLMLINGQRHGVMTCTGQEIVAWSARDENQHCEGLTYLFNTELEENPKLLTEEHVKTIKEMFRLAVQRGISLAKHVYKDGSLRDLSVEDITGFLKRLANARISQLNIGVEEVFDVEGLEVLPQESVLFNRSTMVNFFEAANTSYSLGAMEGEWVYPSEDFISDYDLEQKILNG